MSRASPFAWCKEAVCTQRSTSSSETPSSRNWSTRTGHSSPCPKGVRSPQGLAIRSVTLRLLLYSLWELGLGFLYTCLVVKRLTYPNLLPLRQLSPRAEPEGACSNRGTTPSICLRQRGYTLIRQGKKEVDAALRTTDDRDAS